MKPRERVVVDTNALIGRLLPQASVRVVGHAQGFRVFRGEVRVARLLGVIAAAA